MTRKMKGQTRREGGRRKDVSKYMGEPRNERDTTPSCCYRRRRRRHCWPTNHFISLFGTLSQRAKPLVNSLHNRQKKGKQTNVSEKAQHNVGGYLSRQTQDSGTNSRSTTKQFKQQNATKPKKGLAKPNISYVDQRILLYVEKPDERVPHVTKAQADRQTDRHGKHHRGVKTNKPVTNTSCHYCTVRTTCCSAMLLCCQSLRRRISCCKCFALCCSLVSDCKKGRRPRWEVGGQASC